MSAQNEGQLENKIDENNGESFDDNITKGDQNALQSQKISFQELKQLVNSIDEQNIDPSKYFEIKQMANTLLNRAKRVRRQQGVEVRVEQDRQMLEKTALAQKKKKENQDILKQLSDFGKQKAIEYKQDPSLAKRKNDFNQQDESQDDEEYQFIESDISKKIKTSQQNNQESMDQEDQQLRKDGSLFHLNKPKKCYVCRQLYRKVHPHYHSMCLDCGNFNYNKRIEQKYDLTGKVAIITGGRIKIGYLTSLLLLRNNCVVHVTTRFPKDALERYKKETDYDSFKDRLFIYSLDFRKISSVIEFCDFFKEKFGKLDILINNAAQCVKREASYFKYLIDVESKPLKEYSDSDLKVLQNDLELKQYEADKIKQLNSTQLENVSSADQDLQTVDSLQQNNIEKQLMQIQQTQDLAFCHFSESVLMNVKPVLEGQKTEKDKLYPEGVVDSNGIQVDLASKNSWNSKLDEVPLFEFMETQVINAWAPFVLCQKLKDCMTITPEQQKEYKFIVNVSSVEGQFHMRNKPVYHPHNNMSKASLNMLTRTTGPQYSQEYNIFMTCVDTGWVSNDMIPKSFLFDNVYKTTPLDELDGALRVVDPIFEGYKTKKPICTVFLRNYKVAEW
ncbi:oxidoreductase, short chain dehydrogenase/reductase family protein, putative (macronuclear) [Tetrahymena thermophila SB210]|uniref:Oxidoreductase, short chain dehydrogenase/reductase family protein, putative n=1 Tax=Tetrahymena thermophila (strain SB210) TaxID=312017 RepID=I7M1R8_TETTS|nr:oxidoreductase, short chain dehydrogenase/reductase family protein, putative [Tetrahymena thermophila SB210]EAR97424.1 oxidoreductase, short chain dehydrogenase/reductase family protein, putative [Tetrahymena thermophila SB210]|eukprot:XP_001017669.1 oxidoreductase, short chain dehydrogenase/reductase family protein, putative [Tetrahymena thermophila SB210]